MEYSGSSVMLNFEYHQHKVLDYKVKFSFISKVNAPHMPPEFIQHYATFNQ